MKPPCGAFIFHILIKSQ